jgi:hypothetical protein
MDNTFGTNQNHSNQIYFSSLSTCSNWSYVSNSSGVESLNESVDVQFDYDLNDNNETLNDSNLNSANAKIKSQSLDSLMESEVFLNESIEVENLDSNNRSNSVVQSQLTNFSGNEASSSLNSQINFNLAADNCRQFREDDHQNSTNIQLWQFLLEMLQDKRYRHIIKWLSNSAEAKASSFSVDNEFVICDPKEVAKRWSLRSNRPLNYKKFCRALRYYYNKNKILKKTAGKKNQYCFLINIQPYLLSIINNISALESHQLVYDNTNKKYFNLL